jgi:3-methyladenine DNA glycosylase AlkD
MIKKYTLEKYLNQFKYLAYPETAAGMARFGINPDNTSGVSIPPLRKMATEIGKNHFLAQQFWSSGIHEARILAGSNLFDKTRFSYQKAHEWSGIDEEFIKRQDLSRIICSLL